MVHPVGQSTRSFSLPNQESVFTSEVVALTKLLSYIGTEDDVSYLILSGSLSCLTALRSFHPRNPFVQEVLEHLTALQREGKQITLCWITSHVGMAGNEAVDTAAKLAAGKSCTRRFPLPAGFLPSHDFFLEQLMARNMGSLSWK